MSEQPVEPAQFQPLGIEVRVEILDSMNTLHLGVANFTPYIRPGARPEEYVTVGQAIDVAAAEAVRRYLSEMQGTDTGG